MWKIATDYDYPIEILPYRTSWNNASSGYDFDADAYYVKLNRIYVSPDSLQAKLYKPIWDIYNNNSMDAETFEAKAEPECANCGKIMPSTPFNNLFTAKFCSTKCFRKASLSRKRFEKTFEAIEGKGSNARFTDQPDPKVYRDTSLRQKARNKLLKGDKGGEEGQWSARKAQMSATEYRKLYENKYGEGKNPYF